MYSNVEIFIPFQRENQRLVEENLRLERENDSLAHELVTSQVIMQEQITEVRNGGLVTKLFQLVYICGLSWVETKENSHYFFINGTRVICYMQYSLRYIVMAF